MIHGSSIICVLIALTMPPQAFGLTLGNQDLPPPYVPQLSPPPQQISITGSSGIRLNEHITVVTGSFSDKPTLRLIEEIVSASGGHLTVSEGPSGHGTQIAVGTSQDNAIVVDAAKFMTGEATSDLPAEGYVLATGNYDGRQTVVLHGSDARGTFYAAQTLRQLARGRHDLPEVQVRDWPLMPVRGSVEGFYGIPWPREARLDQFVFHGKHKMNTYIYTPKDDLLLRRNWRDLYEGTRLEEIQELVNTADENHVDFTFALSPGNDLCYSSEEDFNATVTKFNQIRDLGVRRFYLALDDIPTDKFHCDADEQKWKFASDWLPLAEAQTFYLNRLQEEFVEAHGLEDLETVPTSYIGSQPTPYKERFGSTLNKKVRIQWTGEDTMSPNITSDGAVRASKSYVSDNLFVWDNFPVNDMAFDRLFLNPLTGRAPDLYRALLGFTSNPMQQPYASMLALSNYGDYTWNGPKYEPAKSMAAAIEELAGGADQTVRKALVTFVDLNQNWPYREPEVFAPALSKDVEDFWEARGNSTLRLAKQRAAEPLLNRLEILVRLTETLARMDETKFAIDVKPWTAAAAQWAMACRDLISMLDLLDRGMKKEAADKFSKAQEWVEKTKAKTVDTLDRQGNPDQYAPKVGDGVFEKFLTDMTAIYEAS